MIYSWPTACPFLHFDPLTRDSIMTAYVGLEWERILATVAYGLPAFLFLVLVGVLDSVVEHAHRQQKRSIDLFRSCRNKLLRLE